MSYEATEREATPNEQFFEDYSRRCASWLFYDSQLLPACMFVCAWLHGGA